MQPTRPGEWKLLLLVPVLAAGLFGYNAYLHRAPGMLTYEVRASCPVDGTYMTPSGSSQLSKAAVPWSAPAPSDGASLIAQLTCSGNVTARLLKDGHEVKAVSSAGEYVIAHLR